MTLRYEWIDRHREPKCAPNPKWPNGKPLDASEGFTEKCSIDLPYPAKRCGIYMIVCDKCGHKIGITTAGRPDDPAKITLPCYVDMGMMYGTAVFNDDGKVGVLK